ncbi:hypothetical protein Poly24_52130 [Rosistilla carotiformis]|uniref:VWFA domain-containing protein n=1 Tax=Rosistilla carotiformis TaxID=2528017 RepID=A0A518K115_9BACT|nr:hypothetical protein [Rosistilla carotiformis]QDV71477.1 hypothetical protein Poly24_52130 [Rosistilla carotiformis]
MDLTPAYRPDDFTPPHRGFPGWMFSTLLHGILLVSLALLLGRDSQGTGEAPDRPVGIAIVHRMPDRTEYEMAAETASTSDSAAAPPAAAAGEGSQAALPADAAPPLDLDGLLAAALDTPLPSGGSGDSDALQAAAASAGKPSMNLGPSGSQHTTEVFGISGTGSRFVYVFDRSESMNGFGGRPLMAAKMQLVRSIQSLGPEQEFQIIFYNNQPRAFIPGGQMVRLLNGDDQTKRSAEQYVRAMTAFGGTRHMDALLMALRMSPDVIFFLTDARIPRLNGAQLQEIRARAQRSGTTIHTIEFGDDLEPPRDSFLRGLATENGGQYRYLPVGGLDG